jgi:prepilin-type N-terminal cleavage/methylation domain-containing protein
MKNGFSLIELISVVAITAVISLVSVNVLITSQIRGTRANVISQVRREGGFVLDELSFLLRNARYLTENQFSQVCQDNMSAIRAVDQNGGQIEIYLDVDGRVASNSGAVISDPPASYLSSPTVIVSGLNFDCRQDPEERGAFIQVRFKVESGSQADLSPEAYYAQDFTGNVYIRSYQ